MKDCRLAVTDLQRFRELEELWAEELFKHSPGATSTEAIRLRLRSMLPTDNAIGVYGEPKRIKRLLEVFTCPIAKVLWPRSPSTEPHARRRIAANIAKLPELLRKS